MMIILMEDVMERGNIWITEKAGMVVVIAIMVTDTNLVVIALQVTDTWTGNFKMDMVKIEAIIGMGVQEVVVTGMELVGRHVLIGAAIGIGPGRMIVLEVEVVHLLLIAIERLWF